MIAEKGYRTRPNILVTGTPGTGKTTFCRLINDVLRFEYLNVGELVVKHKLYGSWNTEFDVPEFDEEAITSFIEAHHRPHDGGLLVEFHSPDALPEEWFDLVVLLRTDNTILYDRLAARGYRPEKITENVECEIMHEIKCDLEEYFTDQDMVVELDNNVEQDMQRNLERVLLWLQNFQRTHPSEDKGGFP